jgi:PKD repeat protein
MTSFGDPRGLVGQGYGREIPLVRPAMGRRTAAALAIAGLLVVAGLLGAVFSAGPAASSPADPTPLPAAPGNAASMPSEIQVAPGFSATPGVRDLGVVAPMTPFDVAVGLPLQNATGLQAYLTALYVPGTPAYHAFLSVGDLASRYGAAPEAIDTATAYFHSYGLTTEVSPDRLLIDVEGTAAHVAAAFGTTFDRYESPSGREFVSHPTPATLPALAPWTGVLGLGNVTELAPAITSLPGPTAREAPEVACSGSGAFVPCQIWNAYDMASTIAAGTNGSGETIGVVDTYDAQETQTQLESDLASFDSYTALPAPTVNYLYPVVATGNINATYTEWGLEEALDLEWSHASAPRATIDMTFSPNANVGLYQAVDYLVAHQSVNVISMSWGEPDTGIFNAYQGPCVASCNASSDGTFALLSPVLEFAAAEGISVLAASGDCGAADGTSGLAVNYPASDPYVTGVGGTYLTASSSGAWVSEVGWSGNSTGAISPGCQNQGGSGGGFSPFPRPWWQSGTGVPSGGTLRGVPDVSAVSVPGVIVYMDSHQTAVAGTSLATPIWAGISALADEYAHRPLGLLNPSLYAILRGPSYGSDFHDILTGNNTYNAGVGWDPITGIGTPIVGALLPALAAGPSTFSSLQVNLSVSTMAGAAPLTVTFSVTASGGAGGYSAEGVYFGDGNASAAAAGPVTHTFPSDGVYSAQAYASDHSGNFSVSLPVAIVVGGGSALETSLALSTSAPAVDAPVTLTPSVTGGIGPYSYLYYFGDGTYENWTTGASVEHTYGVNGSFCAVVVPRDSATPIDGGVSLPVPVAVGTGSVPTCAATPTPLVVTPIASPGVRDAPADYPALFDVTGGSGTLTEQIRSTDPYVAACGCDIFRAPGLETVRMYANQSGGPPVVAETNVTVAPALIVGFTASATFGPAPLAVTFAATVSGGYDASAPQVNWTFGDGHSALGASAQETYGTAGTYWAVGRLSDGGDGNASEAFLIDVGPSTPSAAPYLNATIAPALDVASGETVHYGAEAHAWNGTATPANFTWQVGAGIAGFSAEVSRTIYGPAPASIGAGNLSVTYAETGTNLTVPFAFAPLLSIESGGFLPRVDGLTLTDTSTPAKGPSPLAWKGATVVDAPGSSTVNWSYGDGAIASGSAATHAYDTVGEYTESVAVVDSWGDRAVDSHGVDVTNGSAVPLTLVSGPSVESGVAPLTVDFTAVAAGGSGAPYTYAWQFGDSDVSASANVSHTYASAGTYTANITVHDARGGSLARSYTIVVVPAVGGSASTFGDLAILVVVLGAVTGGVLAVVFGRRRPPDAPKPTP